ncbi:MAG: phosphohydrolase [Epsilonproteobacteria bacterium]|nr:MAG: phosphohydrolase [Campylobacterota bacterium]
MKITEQIEDLIERRASDFEISKLFKTYIANYKSSLPELFEKNQGKDFLVRHTKSLDTIIDLMYKTVLRQMFGTYLPMRSSIPIAVIALGSYGREQLCVHSDIDLMLVYEENEGYNTDAILEKLLYLAWDAGLKLGHRVHEIKDLLKASREDITIRTSLMESRLITGSTFTWHATQRQLNIIRYDNPKKFILAKIEEANIRRNKYPFSMQPNIKEGTGGMRDSQLLYWIAKTIYGVNSLKELSGTLFNDESYRQYRMALELLFRVRSALHLITNRQQDQLVLEHMPSITKMLGFQDDTKMSRSVLEALWRINNFSQIFLTKMVRPYFYQPHTFALKRSARLQQGFYAIDGQIFATYTKSPQPINKLLELLLLLEDKPWKFDPSFLCQFTYTQINHPLSVKTHTLLRRLFQREHLYSFLQLFYNAGMLHQLISAFKKVLFLPQFDGYHQFPVVLHSIKCVEALENITEPFIQGLYNTLSAKDQQLLKIVVLLHDSGKGRKQDHSDVGVKLIRVFTKKMKLSEAEQQTASLLVKHHVLMSTVAFRENIHNEKTLYKFMSNVQSAHNLKLLYILTYADINGVGPGTFSTFNSKLLKELYFEALDVSEQSLRITDASRRLKIERRIQKLEAYKTLSKIVQKKVLTIESNLFFFKHTPEEIINIAHISRDVKTFTYKMKTENGLSLEIMRKTPLNLSYLLGKLNYMDILSMEVFTLFDNVKYFKIDFLQSPSPDLYESIREIIEDSFDMNLEIQLSEPIIHAQEITIDCEYSKDYAALAVHTTNQRGLLAFIIKCLDDADMHIATAKIDTTKKWARDHFLIEKEAHMCNNSQQLTTLLTKWSC